MDRVNHDPQAVVRELYERYPLLKVLTLRSDGATHDNQRVPPFLGMLLSIIDQRETGASCILLPSRERLGFALALVGALTTLRRSFDELELDRLTTPLRPGSLVRVAPVNRVFEVVEDGKEFQRQRWILLKNPADEQIHYIPEREAFRLTPTTDPSPRPRKGMKPGKWTPAPIDGLLGIRTGGNLAVVPNRVVLVAPRGDTQELATSTLLSAQSCGKTPASELVSWGRIGKDGRVISEDGPREPMVAVTHSVDYLAAASRGPGAGTKIVIADGARALAANLQAYDVAVSRHRVLVLSDHSELRHVGVLADRGCEVWAPRPDTVLIAGEGLTINGGWFSTAGRAARNCRGLSITPVGTTDPCVERLHETIKDVDANRSGDEKAGRLIGQAWLVLATVSGWVEPPGAAALDFFDRNLAEIGTGLQRDRIWLARDVAEGLRQFLDAAADVRDAEEIGGSKRETLLRLLRSEIDVGVVTRSAPEAARIRNLLQRTGFEVPVYPISATPEQHHQVLVMCSWPGRQSMSGMVSRYASPRIDVLTYPFEKPWLSSFVGRWSREWTRYARSGEEVSRMTGLPILAEREPVSPERTPAPLVEDGGEDPLTRILNRRRKGGDPGSVPEKDAREARYVGFHGSAYCFFTEGHRVPVLTDLVLGGEISGDRVPLRPVRKLVPGDFVLFRDHGDNDVIATIAEHEIGADTYHELRRIADIWRPALESIGGDPYTVWRTLRAAGLDRSALTVRAWLTEGERIGPGSERDLRVIADVSGNGDLSAELDRVLAAIGAIRAAHIKAGFTLSELLLRELPGKLPEIDEMGGRVEFTFGGGWVVCIDDIAEAPEERPYWEVNRLLSEDER
jgi:hypothetical protein